MARNLVLWLVIAAVLLTVFNNFSVETQSNQVNYSQFVEEVNRDQIRRVVIEGQTIVATRSNGDVYETIRPTLEDPRLMDDLIQHKIAADGFDPLEHRFVANGQQGPRSLASQRQGLGLQSQLSSWRTVLARLLARRLLA